MSSFSNYGPTDDGRIKPDISSKGVGVLSTSNASDTAYGNSQGTSMSAPAITGLLLLLQQHYNVVNSQYMLAATAKGLLLHTADEAGLFPGPDYGFGWGLANGEKAAQTITNNGIDSYISEVKLDDSQTNTLNIEATGSEPLMVSISWTDAADISTIDETIVDNRVPDLINDLDLKLSKDGTDYYPWKLDYNFPSSPATRNSTNDVDNFEKVEIDAPTAGEIYSVTISHKGTLQGGSQNYSFIVTGGTLQNLSVDDNSLSEFFMWPNPTNDVLNFRFNSMNSSRASVDLIDIQGRNVYSEMLNNSGSKINSTIDVSNLNQGLYILRIKQGNALMNKKVLLR
jgi:subtilisin family serine protease